RTRSRTDVAALLDGEPVDRLLAVLDQVAVRLREGPAAEEAAMRRQRRRMRRRQHAMSSPIDDRALLLRVTAPQHEDDPFTLLVQDLDDAIGERFPTASLMRTGAPSFDR